MDWPLYCLVRSGFETAVKEDELDMVAEHIAALVSPATKLIEVVASGIGSAAGHVFAPYIARRHGKALEIEAEHQAGALRTIAQAQQDTRDILDNPDISFGVDFSINDSIEQFVSYQQERRIRNIGSVAYRAAELLEGVEEVPNEEVDHDWAARFFNEVQDVSSEEMQELWARVLAGQVERPGSTSVKALDILRNMDQDTARLFGRLCSLSVSLVLPSSIVVDSRTFSLGKSAASNSLLRFGLAFYQLNLLNEHGLIISDYNSYNTYHNCIVQDGSVVQPLRYQNLFWALRSLDGFEYRDTFQIHGVALTVAGIELSSAVEIHAVSQYDEALRAYFESLNLEMIPVTGYYLG